MNELLDMVNKREFADVIKILEMGDYPGLSGLALNAITRIFIRQRQECWRGATQK